MELCLLHDRMLQRGMLQRAEGIIGVSKWVNSLGEKTNITEGTQNRTLGHRRAPHSGRGGYKTRAEPRCEISRAPSYRALPATSPVHARPVEPRTFQFDSLGCPVRRHLRPRAEKAGHISSNRLLQLAEVKRLPRAKNEIWYISDIEHGHRSSFPLWVAYFTSVCCSSSQRLRSSIRRSMTKKNRARFILRKMCLLRASHANACGGGGAGE